MDDNVVGNISFSPDDNNPLKSINQQQTDISNRRMNILSITPEGEDPIIYWHQLAQDAVHSADRQRERFKQDQQQLEELQRKERHAQRLKEEEQRHQSIPAFRDLLWMVEQGKFSMNVQLSFYPNTDHVSRRCDYDEE